VRGGGGGGGGGRGDREGGVEGWTKRETAKMKEVCSEREDNAGDGDLKELIQSNEVCQNCKVMTSGSGDSRTRGRAYATQVPFQLRSRCGWLWNVQMTLGLDG
jgi:hypothetical protein